MTENLRTTDITSIIVDIFYEGIECTKKQLQRILKKTSKLDIDDDSLDYHIQKLLDVAIITERGSCYILTELLPENFLPEYLEGVINSILPACEHIPSPTMCIDGCMKFMGCTKFYHEISGKKGGSKQQAYVLLAKAIAKNIKILTRTDNEDVLWYNEEKGIWENNADVLIKYIARKYLPKISKSGVCELIDKIKTSTYCSPEIFDKKNLLALKNGVLNLDIWKFSDHSPLNYLTKRLDITYDEKAECPAINKFLEEILPAGKIGLVAEIIGYCLWPHYDIHKAFMFTGSGSNGKSTLILLIQQFLGEKNVSSVELQELINNKYKVAEIFGKMVNLAADLPSTALTKTGLFKALTGGDWVTAERKNQHPFQFRNTAKMIFSANEIPATMMDDTDAFYRRWMIINFPRQFTNNAIPQEVLLKTLTTPEELSGLLNIVLAGLKELRERSHFDEIIDFEAQRKNYILQSDTVKAFVLYKCELDTDLKIPKDTLYSRYVEYCINEGKTPKANNVFGREIKRWAPGIESVRSKIGNERKTCWTGISTKDLSESGRDGKDTNDISVPPLYFVPSAQKLSGDRKNPVIPVIPDTPTFLVEQIIELIRNSQKFHGSLNRRILISKLPDEDPDKILETLEIMMSNGTIYMPKVDEYKLVED